MAKKIKNTIINSLKTITIKKIILFIVALCIFLAITYELLNWNPLRIFKHVWKLIFPEIFLIVFHEVWSIFVKKKNIVDVIFNKDYYKIIAVTILVWIIACCPAYSAQNHTIGKLLNRFIVHIEEKDVEIDKNINIILDDNNNIVSENLQDYYDKKIVLTDPEKLFQLDSNELSSLYFLDGQYKISDINNEEIVVTVVYKFVKNLLNHKKTNDFDLLASEFLKGEISRVSVMEQDIKSSIELDTIIDIRMDAYNQFPKYTLARLIANNQQKYALLYLDAKGHYETVEYYYAQSIFWIFECLKFEDINAFSTKSILSSLEMRYHDIAEYAKKGSEQRYRATVISEAFKILENQKFN